MFPFIPPRKHWPISAKKYLSSILIEKIDSRRPPGKMTDQGLKKKHHRMAPIKHFLTDIMHISLRD